MLEWLPFPSAGDLAVAETEPASPVLQADSTAEPHSLETISGLEGGFCISLCDAEGLTSLGLLFLFQLHVCLSLFWTQVQAYLAYTELSFNSILQVL